jgi:hypothetical protein
LQIGLRRATVIGSETTDDRSTRVRLYCWQHNALHRLTEGEVERLVYAFTGALADAVTDSGEAAYPRGEPSWEHMECPMSMLRQASDPEGYEEHAQGGVESRRALIQESQ